MDSMWLVKQALQFYMVAVVGFVSRRVLIDLVLMRAVETNLLRASQRRIYLTVAYNISNKAERFSFQYKDGCGVRVCL